MNFDNKQHGFAWTTCKTSSNLLGVEQVCVGINEMDCDIADYEQSRYNEIANEMKSVMLKVGWKKGLR